MITFKILILVFLFLFNVVMIKKILKLRAETEAITNKLDKYNSFNSFIDTMNNIGLKVCNNTDQELLLLAKKSELLNE